MSVKVNEHHAPANLGNCKPKQNPSAFIILMHAETNRFLSIILPHSDSFG
jgi:hypothetical protein